MKILLFLIALLSIPMTLSAQTPPIESGIPLELAKWRAEHYSNIRYGLDIWLEKGAQTVRGKLAVEVEVGSLKSGVREEGASSSHITHDSSLPIILDWRRISGHEKLSKISNVTVNGKSARYEEVNEHLVFSEGVLNGKNRIDLDFESPILPSGSAITRYIDKEDGAEYLYSLFVPSDASTAFPVFDQPDLKARFKLTINAERQLPKVVSNSIAVSRNIFTESIPPDNFSSKLFIRTVFEETKPISTYVFAFAAGPFEEIEEQIGTRNGSDGHSKTPIRVLVRKSQAEKFKQHSSETFRLNREAIRYLEDYFDYPFPFPKYDVVLIPEFPFGGMEHAGATFLRETSVIFPTEPTANNYISRATLIFHEAAHQWFGDTVTMRWFDDLWLKEGFATFMAHKTMEKVLPEYDPWKVFYQRVKPTAYATDVTRGTVPIYQDIPNLNSAKSAYGAIVYQKAPSFLRQAEFYLGEGRFKQAVRSFLKDNEYANAEWSDLVGAFEKSSGSDLESWADVWVKKRSLPIIRLDKTELREYPELGKPHDTALIYSLQQEDALGEGGFWPVATEVLQRFDDGRQEVTKVTLSKTGRPDKLGFARYWTYLQSNPDHKADLPVFVFPNYRDYGYGIFLLDEKSRNYILENIRTEKDEFLRAQMWGSLWDSVRFAELAPVDYIDLAIANIDAEKDETTISSILGRTAYAYTYYLSESQQSALATKLESLLVDKMLSAPTVGQRITYYRALLGVAKGEQARKALKALYAAGAMKSEVGSQGSEIGTRSGSDGQERSQKSEVRSQKSRVEGPRGAVLENSLSPQPSVLTTPEEPPFPIRPKDRFDIATRLIEIGDPDGVKFLAELEKTEKDDAALRWAYAAKAAFASKENKEKFWKDFTQNTEISESWIEEAFGVWNSPAHAELTLPYLDDALAELPKLKRNRKIFFVNGWLGAFIGGQTSIEALKIVNQFLEKNPGLDADLRRKILENVDGLDRAVKIRSRYGREN